MSTTLPRAALSELLDTFPTPVLDAVAARLTTPAPAVPTPEEHAAAAAWPADGITAQHLANARHRESCARLLHHLAAALLVDSLLEQTAGSGLIADDAAKLVTDVLDFADVTVGRRRPPTPEEVTRAEWVLLRQQLTALVLTRDGASCRYCRDSGVRLTIDHLTPISRGGTNDPANLGVACGPCNSRKGTKTEAEYHAWLAVTA